MWVRSPTWHPPTGCRSPTASAHIARSPTHEPAADRSYATSPMSPVVQDGSPSFMAPNLPTQPSSLNGIRQAPLVLSVNPAVGNRPDGWWVRTDLPHRGRHQPTRSGEDPIDEDTVKGRHAAGVIEYLGATSDVRPFIAVAHCIVLPSYREGTGRALMEAAAMAPPLIATDVPGYRAVVDREEADLLCDARGGSSLAAACLRFLAWHCLTRTNPVWAGPRARRWKPNMTRPS